MCVGGGGAALQRFVLYVHRSGGDEPHLAIHILGGLLQAAPKLHSRAEEGEEQLGPVKRLSPSGSELTGSERQTAPGADTGVLGESKNASGEAGKLDRCKEMWDMRKKVHLKLRGVVVDQSLHCCCLHAVY